MYEVWCVSSIAQCGLRKRRQWCKNRQNSRVGILILVGGRALMQDGELGCLSVRCSYFLPACRSAFSVVGQGVALCDKKAVWYAPHCFMAVGLCNSWSAAKNAASASVNTGKGAPGLPTCMDCMTFECCFCLAVCCYCLVFLGDKSKCDQHALNYTKNTFLGGRNVNSTMDFRHGIPVKKYIRKLFQSGVIVRGLRGS